MLTNQSILFIKITTVLSHQLYPFENTETDTISPTPRVIISNKLKNLLPTRIKKTKLKNFYSFKNFAEKKSDIDFEPKPAKIFFWSELYKKFHQKWNQEYHSKNEKYKEYQGCDQNYKCDAFFNRPKYKIDPYEAAGKADVVVMSPLFDTQLDDLDFDKIRKIRRKEQIWVWFQWESPQFHDNDFTKFDNFFNATLSYRFDSTFWYPYSSMVKNKLVLLLNPKFWRAGTVVEFSKREVKPVTDEALDENMKNSANTTSNKLGAAAVISNCDPQYRGKIVQKLGNLLKYPDGSHALDVFGACNNRYQKYKTATRDKYQTVFQDKKYFNLENVKHYKFFVSFENSRCRHYITEKFFSNAYLSNAVPIVAGAPRADYEYVAPKDSFIHVDDFETVEELADRINFLINPENDAEYRKYFEWKKRMPDHGYHLTDLKGNRESGLCGLCKAAFEIKNEIRHWDLNVVEDLQTWWYGKREKAVFSSENWKGDGGSLICLKNDLLST